MTFDFTLNRLENADKRRDDFIDENIVDWTETVLLFPTRRRIIQFGLSQSAADAVTVIKTGYMKAEMQWEYRNAEGKPLHLWLEKGFGKGGYDIEAKGKQNGGKDYLKFKDKAGKNIFIPRGKKVRHPGFFGYHILGDTWKEKKPQLTRRIIEETNNFLEVNKLG